MILSVGIDHTDRKRAEQDLLNRKCSWKFGLRNALIDSEQAEQAETSQPGQSEFFPHMSHEIAPR